MTWWHYLLLVNFYLLLFFGFYALLLRKETFFQLNRVYLVAASLLSFLIPLIQADWVTNLFITQQVQRTVYGGTLMLNMTPEFVVSGKSSGITFGEIVNAIYITVTIFLIIRLAWQLLVLKKAINEPSPSAAYSFFKKISLGEKVSQSSVIAEHEAVHASQWHSIDVMIIEMVMIINWFNPVVYLYRFAIKYIHEFIADRQVIERGTDKVDYALLLLSQTFEIDTHNLVTPFYNHSLLKKRIKMLQKNKSHRIMLAKYGLSAPLFILMMILSSATVKNSKAINVISKKTAHVLQMPAVEMMSAIDNNGEIPAENKVAYPAITNEPAAANVVNNTDTIPGNKVFSQVERMPEFPGGLQAFGKFLSDNIRYPKADHDNGVSGRVFCTFIVEIDGTLSDIKAVRGPSAAMSAEAVRVLTKSPKWKPGFQNGHPVRVTYTVPINFALEHPAGGVQSATSDTGKVYAKVSGKMPEFPGGLQGFGEFLSNNIKYPKEDRDKGVSGKVFCTFIIEKDGAVSDIRAIRGPSQAMMDEAIRVMTLSPKWQPGTDVAGKPVRVSYTVPIKFTLEAQDNGMKKSNGVDSLVKIGSNGHPPLYIIDGTEYKADLVMPKPEEIASIEVLRNENATKVYGEKAKYGVIIITTKKKK
jgi:TonB family protein